MDNPRDRKAYRHLCVAASARQLNKMLHDATTSGTLHDKVRIAIIETVADQFDIVLKERPPACCMAPFTTQTVAETEGVIFVTTWCNREVSHLGPHALEDGMFE